jgi:hypothetical protein
MNRVKVEPSPASIAPALSAEQTRDLAADRKAEAGTTILRLVVPSAC